LLLTITILLLWPHIFLLRRLLTPQLGLLVLRYSLPILTLLDPTRWRYAPIHWWL
jgi:hypothetical protein